MYSIIIPLRLLTILTSLSLFFSLLSFLLFFSSALLYVLLHSACIPRSAVWAGGVPFCHQRGFFPSFLLSSFSSPLLLSRDRLCSCPSLSFLFFILLVLISNLIFPLLQVFRLRCCRPRRPFFGLPARHPLQPADLSSFCSAFVLFLSPFLSLLHLVPFSLSLLPCFLTQQVFILFGVFVS